MEKYATFILLVAVAQLVDAQVTVQITGKPQGNEVNQGDAVSMKCEATGLSLTSRFAWTKDAQAIHESNSETILNPFKDTNRYSVGVSENCQGSNCLDLTLDITAAYGDGGKYKCSVTDKNGVELGSDEVDLTVKEEITDMYFYTKIAGQDQVELRPASPGALVTQVAEMQDAFVLGCAANGSGGADSININMKIEGTDTDAAGFLPKTEHEIIGVTPIDYKKYSSSVENKDFAVDSFDNVYVCTIAKGSLKKEMKFKVAKKDAAKPVITRCANDVTSYPKEAARFWCEFSKIPDSTVMWQINANTTMKPSESKGRLQVSAIKPAEGDAAVNNSRLELTVSNVIEDDTGDYVFVASNSNGQVTKTIKLRVSNLGEVSSSSTLVSSLLATCILAVIAAFLS